jgi:hypothetical protein
MLGRMGTLGIGPDPYYDPTLDPFYVSGGDPNQLPMGESLPPIASPGPAIINTSPSATPAWIALLAGAEKTISNIFAPPATSIAQAGQNAAYSQTNRYPIYNASGQVVGYSSYPQTQGTVQPGASVGTGGLNLFGSQIGWGTIALVGGLILLIQMPGFTRRGR